MQCWLRWNEWRVIVRFARATHKRVCYAREVRTSGDGGFPAVGEIVEQDAGKRHKCDDGEHRLVTCRAHNGTEQGRAEAGADIHQDEERRCRQSGMVQRRNLDGDGLRKRHVCTIAESHECSNAQQRNAVRRPGHQGECHREDDE